MTRDGDDGTVQKPHHAGQTAHAGDPEQPGVYVLGIVMVTHAQLPCGSGGFGPVKAFRDRTRRGGQPVGLPPHLADPAGTRLGIRRAV
jgi:hypothetical protein